MNKAINKTNFLALFIALATPLLLGFLSGIVTKDSIPLWFNQLNKPWFNPPSWLFGPVWTILYIMMGYSSYLIYLHLPDRQAKKGIMIYSVQLFLNFMWSILFFGLRNPKLALMEIMLMWIAIVITIFYFSKTSKRASWLLVPYISWVSFATILNYFMYQLNP
jgi:tryptophan-rich sensory protein